METCTGIPDSANEPCVTSLLKCLRVFQSCYDEPSLLLGATAVDATTSAPLQGHAQLISASSAALARLIQCMKASPDTAIVRAMVLADTPRTLGVIWKLLLSMDNLEHVTTCITSLMLPMLMKSVEVFSLMGAAVEAVQKRTKLVDLEIDAPARWG